MKPAFFAIAAGKSITGPARAGPEATLLNEAAARVEQVVRAGPIRFLLLFAFALVLYGHTMSYGFVYDDVDLLRAHHLAWLTRPWFFETYYRPLQAPLFSPYLVGTWAPFLHFQNLLVGTLVVFLFGRLLQRIGFTAAMTFAIELTCLALPTSMMLMVWISQRTDWPVLLLGLGALLLSFSALRARSQVAVLMALSAVALLSKESGAAVVVVAPLFVLAYHRRRGLALALAIGGVVVFAGYLWLRLRVLPAGSVIPTTVGGAVELGIGMLEALIYPSIQVCFTYDPFVLVLNLGFLLMAVSGAVSMLRASRLAALGLLAVFAAFVVAVATLAEPRNLVVPGFVTATFAIYFVGRVLTSSSRSLGIVVLTLLLLNIGVLASLSVVSSYPLQDWIQPVNARLDTLAAGARPHGSLYELDVNTRFREDMREALKAWYRSALRPRPATPGNP